MKDENKVDLGSIQIHKKVIADIASSAISDIQGVRLIPSDIKSSILELLGQKGYPGIIVGIDKDNNVSLEVKILVKYGLSIPSLARQIQDAIRAAIDKAVDINFKEVNVNVQGIERGE